MKTAQEFSVKRAQVEFHNFASLGEPERVSRVYQEENDRRRGFLLKYRDFIGEMTPFLEIGANAGHTSYMIVNEFNADGFALDISADALRHGLELGKLWGLDRGPVRVAGDAINLPFADGSLRIVLAYQMLSQFMDIERVFVEVKRVLAPGGLFLFAEEPMRRKLSLRLYRCPYYETMKPWERKLHDWGLLGYVVRDVIGAHQEESFGIRQNHTMGLREWDGLIRKHFAEWRYDIYVPERGWGERLMKKAAIRSDPNRSQWRAGLLLGGTMSAVSRKAGESAPALRDFSRFEELLRCPDCHHSFQRDSQATLRCLNCGYEAKLQGGVYNLLPSIERDKLYPGARPDILDFSQPEHAAQLGEGWFELEGVYGNRFRWMGDRATVQLHRVDDGPQSLRIRGHVQPAIFASGQPVHIGARVNGSEVGSWTLDRSGLFVHEVALPLADRYDVELFASPSWQPAHDARQLTVNISLIRLIPAE